jgi:hypothetical protein
MTPQTGRKVSILLFSMGVLIGFILAGVSVWANFELPVYFDYNYASIRSTDQSYSDLNCPLLLTTSETGRVVLDIPNTTDKPIEVLFRAEISYLGGIVRNFEVKPSIPAGESQRVEFEINADDVVFNSFILVKTYQFPTYKTPSRMGSCAILMLPIPFLTGQQAFIATILMIAILIISGIYLWIKHNRPHRGVARNATSAMITLALFLLVALVSGYQGWWVAGLFLLVVVTLLIVVSVVYFSTSPQDNRY